MPPVRDHFSGGVNLDGAGSVMRGLVSPVPVGLRHMPDRETGDQADWIFYQPRKFPQLPWLVLAWPRPGSLAGLIVDPGSELSFALAPYHPAGQTRGTT
jgi:hypothetical protein